MTLEKFNGLLTSFFSQRAEPYQMNVIEIITGNGGFNMMKNLLKHLPEQNGMITNSDKYLSGPTNDMFFATPSITSYQFVYGTIKFKLNRSLDPLNDSDVENPKIGGFRLSSYMFIVMDALGGNNVKMLRCKEGWDFQWRFENGKSNYMGSQTGFHGKINAPYDFLVAMEKKHYAYWLQDPTRSFIMKPYNPITKKPFGEI
jgi:hypothetical protein